MSSYHRFSVYCSTDGKYTIPENQLTHSSPSVIFHQQRPHPLCRHEMDSRVWINQRILRRITGSSGQSVDMERSYLIVSDHRYIQLCVEVLSSIDKYMENGLAHIRIAGYTGPHDEISPTETFETLEFTNSYKSVRRPPLSFKGSFNLTFA